MGWLWKDIKSTARQYWLTAQGIPSFLHMEWHNKGLFHRTPAHCQICRQEWRPDKPVFVAVMGKIIRTKFGPKWYCEQLGLVRDTGHLDDHPRYVCRECGAWPVTIVTDCLSGEKVGLRPRPSLRFRLKRDIIYWTKTALKFVWYYVETWRCFIRQPRHYIRCRKVIYGD
jgi:hypothetical protein